MLIHQAAAAAGLTRKAIRYYEEQGLLQPPPPPSGPYRRYSGEDVQRLSLIRQLRRLGLSITQIRELLEAAEPQSVRRLLHTRLERQEQEIRLLEAERTKLRALLSSDSCLTEEGLYHALCRPPFPSIDPFSRDQGDPVRQLVQGLGSLFPGPLGKMMAQHFAPFLAEPPATEAEKQAWTDLVSYLDETDAFHLPPEFARLYDSLSERAMEDLVAAQHKHVMELLEADEETLSAMAANIRKQVQEQSSVHDFMNQMMPTMKSTKQALEQAGYYAAVPQLMKRCSPAYARYLDKLERLQALTGVQYGKEGYVLADSKK